MQPIYRRFTVPAALSAEECDRLCGMTGFRPARIQQEDGGGASGVRTSSAVDLPHGQGHDWLVARLHPHVLALNQTLDFEIAGYSPPTVLKYEVGERYDWHVDLGRDDLATRKLSLIVLLTDPGDYDGGDLEWAPDLGPCPRDRGTLILFPAFMPHRVTAVTRGTRHTLVTWVHGDRPFR